MVVKARKAGALLGGLAAICGLGAPARAQAPAAPPPAVVLSPEGLGRLIECRATGQELWAYGEALLGKDQPVWLSRVEDNGHPGMLGLWTYHLSGPITVFGRLVDTVSFLNQWVVIEVPRAAALGLVRERGLTRAPVKITEQYYHFADPEHGPMLGAFAPTDNAMDLLLGDKPKADEENTTLFIGCNYAAMSQKDFLDAATQADAMLSHDK